MAEFNPKYNCGDRRSNAACVFYDLNVPEYSKLSDEECLTIQETTSDLYKHVTWLRESVEVGESDGCLDVEKIKDSYNPKTTRYLLKDIVKELSDKVCNLETNNEEQEDDTLSLDFKCLTTSCGNPISSLKDLLQTLIDEICLLKGE